MLNVFLLITICYFSPCRSQNYNLISDGDLMMTINTSGNNATGTSGTVSYSLGQVFYTYTGLTDYTLAEGIQHFNIDNILAIKENSIVIKNEILLFPNPVNDIVNLNIGDFNSEKGKQFYHLYDLQGRLLREDIIEDLTTQINLADLKSAIYIFSVFCDNKVLKTFKVIKN
ncbi:hypothetical protein RCH18_002542 [Flavobacterium sp. PL11]|nr:hypothetical protein [Flavobacterium sp. PL11]